MKNNNDDNEKIYTKDYWQLRSEAEYYSKVKNLILILICIKIDAVVWSLVLILEHKYPPLFFTYFYPLQGGALTLWGTLHGALTLRGLILTPFSNPVGQI